MPGSAAGPGRGPGPGRGGWPWSSGAPVKFAGGGGLLAFSRFFGRFLFGAVTGEGEEHLVEARPAQRELGELDRPVLERAGDFRQRPAAFDLNADLAGLNAGGRRGADQVLKQLRDRVQLGPVDGGHLKDL